MTLLGKEPLKEVNNMAILDKFREAYMLFLNEDELRVLKAALVEAHDARSEAINQGLLDEEFVEDTCILGDICQALGIEGFEFT